MLGIIVRALWGGSEIVTSAKAREDVSQATQFRDLIRVEQRVIAFGDSAGANLRGAGLSPVVIGDDLPGEYSAPRPMPKRLPATDEHGRWKDGLTMWWRKLHAIRVAWDTAPYPEAVIWLDWDTGIEQRVTNATFKRLALGPQFCGRQRQYFRPQHFFRTTSRRQVYHGGCFYLRGRYLIDRLLKMHATQFAMCTDEVPLTKLADELSGTDDQHKHRALGYDNDWLYSTRHNVVPSDASAMFTEGAYASLKRHLFLAAVDRP